MFFQSVSAEVDGVTCDKDSNGKIKVKDGGIGNTQLGTGTSLGDGAIKLMPWAYNSITAGTWAFQSITCLGHYEQAILNASGANNDEINWKAYLSAGTYTIKVLTMNHNQGGTINVEIDGSNKGSTGTYNAGNQYNQVHTYTGITVSAAGIVDIGIKASADNGQYKLYISGIVLYRTA